MHLVVAGQNPYAVSIQKMQVFHDQEKQHLGSAFPLSYVYTPLSLPVLRLAGRLPSWLTGKLYFIFYVSGVLTQVIFTSQLAFKTERQLIRFIVPCVVFFPGFLVSDTILSGNIAYIFYGLALLTAVRGWRLGQWRWFYLVVIVASCFKPPMLVLMTIPVLTSRNQWLRAASATGFAAGLLAVSRMLWPLLYRSFLQAVDIQMKYNHDFGCSPAGLFAAAMYDRHIPYMTGFVSIYLLYAVPTTGVLFCLSRRFLGGAYSREQWLPVLLLGVMLLNPRLIEYDLALVTLPIALIFWRFFSKIVKRPMLMMAVTFLTANLIALQNWETRKWVECLLLFIAFAAGIWTLARQADMSTSPPNDCVI